MIDDVKGKYMGQVIRIDETRIKDHLGEMVRGTVKETLNAMLDAGVDALCGAARYERSLHTKAGDVKLKV
jgi:transposase-like protein